MKWVLGTGRCGLHRYTAQHGGLIETNEKFHDLVVKRYHGEMSMEELAEVKEFFRERAQKPVPLITDCSQFMYVDLILKVDPAAEFVWIIGKKEDVVEGFMRKNSEERRIHPKGWHFHEDNKRRLLNWYYDEVNWLIHGALVGKGLKFEIVKTEDIPACV